MLYTATYYMPWRQCREVKLVETVLVAELTEAVQRAITAGTLCETVCEGCDARLSPSLPILLCTPGSDTTVVYSPPGGDRSDLDFTALVVADCRAEGPRAESPFCLCRACGRLRPEEQTGSASAAVEMSPSRSLVLEHASAGSDREVSVRFSGRSACRGVAARRGRLAETADLRPPSPRRHGATSTAVPS